MLTAASRYAFSLNVVQVVVFHIDVCALSAEELGAKAWEQQAVRYRCRLSVRPLGACAVRPLPNPEEGYLTVTS